MAKLHGLNTCNKYKIKYKIWLHVINIYYIFYSNVYNTYKIYMQYIKIRIPYKYIYSYTNI